MPIIEFRGVDKFFGDFHVFKGIDFSVDEGSIVEVGPPDHFFVNPEHDRTKRFLNQIVHWLLALSC